MMAEKQFNYKNYTILYLSNLYGKHDHYFSNASHFVSSFISKLLTTQSDEIEMYGTGKPLRQFTYANDIVEIVKNIIGNNLKGRYNIANQENLTITEMAFIIMDIFGTDKRLLYNNKLDGVYRKDICNKKLLSVLPEIKFTKFKDGIKLLKKEIECFGV